MNRSGSAFANSSTNVLLPTSPSIATTSPLALPERDERVAESLARRLLGARLVRGQPQRGGREPMRLAADLGLGDVDMDVADAAELGDRRVRVGERLAVVAGLVGDRLDAVALLGAGDDHRRLSGRLVARA